MSHKLNFIDLFAGCGGLSEGFLQTEKYNAIAHVEWEIPMVNTLRNRLVKKWGHTVDDARLRTIHFDIQKTTELIDGKWDEESIKKYGKTNHEDIIRNGLSGIVGGTRVDLIIGGPPCQAYSIAGRAQDKNSMKDDYRNYLFESFVKVVKEYQPKLFLFENVPGILSASPGNEKVTSRIYKAFQDIGYEILEPSRLNEAVLTATEFGVPQNRRRVIIIGVRENSSLSLDYIYNEISKQKIISGTPNVDKAIGNLPALYPIEQKGVKKASHKQLENVPEIRHHQPRFHNQRDVNIFYEWIDSEMNKKSSDEKIAFYNNYTGKSSNHPKYRNLEWDKPSPTIVAHLYKDGLMFIHPDKKQARSITVKEAALLQSFPDEFEFEGSMGSCYKMIGNAVPPLMARSIANSLYNLLKQT